MASPFPGMDPYLEQPALWASFHSRLIVALADAIESALQPEYYVEVESRTYLSEGDAGLLIGIPDVVVAVDAEQSPALAESRRSSLVSTQVRPQQVQLPMPETVTERYLEIRDLETGDVITAIEVLSPKNKQPGKGRVVYTEKRNQVLSSLTHLVEIDLLRRGRPFLPVADSAPGDYRILVSVSTQRPTADLYQVPDLYQVSMGQPLPDIPIPLKQNDQPVVVHLQGIIAGVYDRGRYHSRINYQQQPPPPQLSEADQQWRSQLTQDLL